MTGPITAANAAVEADGAALCLIVSDRLAARAPRALRLVSGVTLGAAPDEPGLAPVPAIAASLATAGLQPGNLALAEIMEAYAVQAIACVEGAGLDPAIVNCGGGALRVAIRSGRPARSWPCGCFTSCARATGLPPSRLRAGSGPR